MDSYKVGCCFETVYIPVSLARSIALDSDVMGGDTVTQHTGFDVPTADPATV